ncbi:Deoxyguanosinetriphosphate triphosphohydrolase [Leminorella richardii]|uniref:Deoxyguanosinetriphosphate triphosphohydrolase n=1 Tax=Leminorella richardii TaxID=158841 RepID=A0A2X4V2P2_9GAMM|nr:dGTPase [Leminorella richardii]SQI42388.1 Deoxyguanosinetriphosphate triphosphohydrolase [Leminorella richardii]
MSGIDFSKRIRIQRPFSSSSVPEGEYDISRQFESDRGRIINSAAIRRLQQKTQVFPLERNAAVRSRLTHSMEVQQVGRHIAKEIFSRLKKAGRLQELGLENLVDSFESIVEMACLMHDVGNPPFGHFGEAAINNWFRKRLRDGAGKLCHYPCLRQEDEQPELNQLRLRVCQDLGNFEGNAQAIRLVHTLLKLNLTYSQVACILKYTRPAYWSGEVPEEYSYLMKKPGYYMAEERFVSELRYQLGMEGFSRYPLTYIMEAADDISYCIADLEDAVEKNILTVEQLYDHLKSAWGDVNTGDLFDKTVGGALRKVEQGSGHRHREDQFFMYLRVFTIAQLVPRAAERFITHLPAIFEGSFNQALLEGGDEAFKLLSVYKDVALTYVFSQDEVEQLELQGYRVISGLLDIYSPLLDIPMADFNKLVSENRHRGYLIETRLYHKLSTKHCMAYKEAVAQLGHLPEAQREIREFYYRARLIQDYISGMTDLYAYDEYRRLMAAD